MNREVPVGTAVSEDVAVRGQVLTKVDLAECHSLVRSGSARWCWWADDFETIADEIIARALMDFDATRGRFDDRLVTRARNRMARTLVRTQPVVERRAEMVDIVDVREAVLIRAEAVANDPAAGTDAVLTVHGFVASLMKPEQQAVANLLAVGLNQAEISDALRLHARRVSRIVASLRPLAADYFDRPDLWSPAA
jgi:hypothetical protein